MFDRKIKIALVLSSLLSIVACSDYLDEFQNEYEDSFVALDIPVSSEEALSSEEGKSSDKGTSSSSQEDDSGNSSANSSASENSSDRDDSSSSVNSSDSSNSSSSVNSSDSGNSSSSVNSSGSGDSSSSVNSSSSVPSFGTCAPSISTVTTNSTVMWLFSWNDADTTLAAIEKAMASYKWLSEGGSPASGTSGTFSTSYASSGMKTASVEVTVRSKGTQVIECSTLQVTSGADETSTVQCQSGDMWCKNESYRVNTGIDAGLDNGGQWWAKTDVIEPSPGASKLNWTPALGTDSSFNSVIDHCNGLCGTYNLDKGNLDFAPWVEVGFSIAGKSQTSTDNLPADLTDWGGICITYTSDMNASLEMLPDGEMERFLGFDVPFVSLLKQSNAIEKCFEWSKFIQAGWGAEKISGDVAATYVKDIAFKIQGSDGSTGKFNIIRLRKMNAGGVGKLTKPFSLNLSYLNDKKKYELIRDERDGQFYATIKIGEQTWMAQNLNYAYNESSSDRASRSTCYENDPANCEIYGKLYGGTAAMKVCPDGWRLPLKSDFETLIEATGADTSVVGTILKTDTGWDNVQVVGTDNLGFSALPAGIWNKKVGEFSWLRGDAHFWTSEALNSSSATYGFYLNTKKGIGQESYSTDFMFSVRCLKND